MAFELQPDRFVDALRIKGQIVKLSPCPESFRIVRGSTGKAPQMKMDIRGCTQMTIEHRTLDKFLMSVAICPP
jgi:hypothetical protein